MTGSQLNSRLFPTQDPMANKLPTFDHLMNPIIRALRAMGGSGSIEEIYDKVVELE
jgi:restriction system protein